jgi:hypothetical protein
MVPNDETWEVYNIWNLSKDSLQTQLVHKLWLLLKTNKYKEWVNRESIWLKACRKLNTINDNVFKQIVII